MREGEAAKSFAFFAVGVENARMDILAKISVREPLKLQGLRFRELFQWLSNSMKSVSQSVPGTAVPIGHPADGLRSDVEGDQSISYWDIATYNKSLCQDDCFADVFVGCDGASYLVSIVADGAGSAMRGGDGAGLTCATAARSIEASLH